jgi:hypothetical protein
LDAETVGSNRLKAWMFVLVYSSSSSSSSFTCHPAIDAI